MSLLRVDGLRAGYGAVQVLHGLDFTVEEGQTAVLFGLNGAGKTTTVNTVAGLLPAWSGEIRFDGSRVDNRPAADVVALGVALCPEGRRVFPGLSIRQNLELGAWTRRGTLRAQLDRVFGYFPRLEERAGQLAGTLSGGEQQMLAVGRALMSRPRLLLIDEASLGLAPRVASMLFDIVRQINLDGTTVVIVEQNAGVLRIADRALVMEKGTLVFDGAADELRSTGALREAYLG